jgi:hypothetical protein
MKIGGEKVFSRTHGLLGRNAHRQILIDFAKQHDLIYFDNVKQSESYSIVKGSTASLGHSDNGYLIGAHAGYDMTIVDRTSTISFDGYKSTKYRWYVVQIDLKHASSVPYIFIGTKQQTKAYYARIFASKRDIGYLQLPSSANSHSKFHSTYAVLASPAIIHTVYALLTDEIIETLAMHRYPFAIEIEDETLTVITEASKTNQQLLDKLLHFGLWFAKEVDKRLV